MVGVLATSVVFTLDPSAARGKVLLYLLVSAAPFAIVAPAIGPTVDRFPGGRRIVIQVTAVARAAIYAVMAFHYDDLLFFPLVFGAMVMQKTYAVSKSALMPSVVRSDEELVEANSKLSLISGLVGAIAIAPLAGLGKVVPPVALFLGMGLFVVMMFAANRLPRDVVAAAPVRGEERAELRSGGVVLAAGSIALIRAMVGFLTFHLYFWLRAEYGLVEIGFALAAAAVGSMFGNLLSAALRRVMREELMLLAALGLSAAAGTGAALMGGLAGALMVAFMVNLAAATGRLAFDAIVQRDAPDANLGRAFSKFEARFQLSQVLASVAPVFFTMPGQVGFLVVGSFGVFAMVTYLFGYRAVQAGRPAPRTLTQRAKDGIQNGVARRRGDTSSKGMRRPARGDDQRREPGGERQRSNAPAKAAPARTRAQRPSTR